MASTFPRINSVNVDTSQNETDDFYPDAGLAVGGSWASAVPALTGATATYGQLWRGMPVGILPATGKLVPVTASSAVPVGFLLDDITAFTLARGTKIAVVKRGRIRTYAGGPLAAGDPVKVDTSTNFSGVVKWISGTDDASLRLGRVYMIDDGSASGTPAVSAAQGDTVFLELNGI
jgi:hypothetical protein